jgi:photosystem II stability/assembly factor-like uncharacterized protein
MKNVSFVSGLLFLCAHAMAQNEVDGNTVPVKFSDVVAAHEQQQPSVWVNDDKETGTPPYIKGKFLHDAEDNDYQFDRWKWYWQQHLDPNGYMVSPVKTWNEWQQFQQKRKAARTTSSDMSAWTFAGPDSSGSNGSGVGRINVVAFHPTNSNTYWIGSPGGGAWKTTNNGVTWKNMTDKQPLLSISDIKFNPQNPNTIYLCTGDRDGADYYSTGVLKSYDGGATWHNTGLVWSESSMDLANSLLINPSDTNTLILGSSLGIYISHNGGTTWTLTPSSSALNIKQVLYNPADTNIVYATSRYKSPGVPGQIYRSADGGTTWAQITSFTDAYRIQLAVTPASAGTVKALVASSSPGNRYGLEGIYNSADAGLSYSLIYAGGCSGHTNILSFQQDGTGCGGQGQYDLSFAISPTNANNVYVGGVNGWQSATGGSTWVIMDQWSAYLSGVVTVHADKHFMGFNPLLPSRFFECNDGGIYWSDNPSGTSVWNDVTNGLGITEFYRVAVSNVATYQLAGAQDNGTKVQQFGASQDFLGGDGMECQLDPLDSNTAYASSQFGNIFAYTSGFTANISHNIPGTPTGGWITPFVLEPSCNLCLLAGYQDVYQSTDQGSSWTDLSGPLTGTSLLRVVTSLSDVNTIYATETGTAHIFYTNDGGATWTTITAPYSGAIISDIIVDKYDATKITVTFSGYSSPQVVTYSTGAGWAGFNTGLPNVPVNCINVDTSNLVAYIGTDIGVFYRDYAMTSWQPFQGGLPVVRVNDLQFDYATGSIWAATYGRSLWSSPRQLSSAAATLKTQTTVVPQNVRIFPNPNHGSFNVTLSNNFNKNVQLKLVNNIGSAVWVEHVPVNNGSPIKVNTGNLPGGMYILEVYNDDDIIDREKVVIY